MESTAIPTTAHHASPTLGKALEGLEYFDHGWHRLPHWCRFLLAVGGWLTGRSQAEPRIMAVVVVPTRAYAALLVALGAILANVDYLLPKELESRAASLRRARDGTPVRYAKNWGTSVVRPLRGTTIVDDREYFRLDDSRDRNSRFILVPANRAMRIELVEKPGGRDVTAPRFVRSDHARPVLPELLGEESAIAVSYRQRLEVSVVGDAAPRLAECDALNLRYDDGNVRRRSTNLLGEVLQPVPVVRRDESYRSEILGYRRGASFERLTDLCLEVIDGCPAFLRHLDSPRCASTVAVLGQADSKFDEAMGEVARRGVGSGTVQVALPEALSYVPMPIGFGVYPHEGRA